MIRIFYCSVCENFNTFHYIGTQRDLNGNPLLDLYNCNECNNTKAMEHRPEVTRKLEGGLTVSEFKIK